ncbi:hypothetical protein RFI_10720 [Reticulomyxa filosa]|uniref:PH domain-containing protein n=1 Tax=Reticulomyxa filosa TaxID=46433 RepID=X6NM26_RETFI|nr:hypothetical protein RFI_10720 [Reticulomyxa filosa]|eukprot:ETO26417.1 hypothetical protein RFI_10720 [Reticulomyxa filosa]
MKEFTKREEVKEIERKFAQKVKLLAPARQFIRRGKLWKVCRKQDRVYHFFLFTDLLLYASQYGTKLNLHNQLQINNAFQVKWLDQQHGKYAFIQNRAFEIVSSKKSFVAYADSAEEAKSWYEDVKKAVKSILEEEEEEDLFITHTHTYTHTHTHAQWISCFINRWTHAKELGKAQIRAPKPPQYGSLMHMRIIAPWQTATTNLPLSIEDTIVDHGLFIFYLFVCLFVFIVHLYPLSITKK